MKYPKNNKSIVCDPDFINRYYDGEVSAEEHKSFSDHIKGCASCEKLLQEFRYVSDHYRVEINEANPHTEFDAIRDGVSLRSEIEGGHKSVILCQLGNIAYRTGRNLNIDQRNGRIIGDAEAMKLWSRSYEPGWEIRL